MRAPIGWISPLGLLLLAALPGAGAREPEDPAFGLPAAWLRALGEAEVTHPARLLVHASRTCTLRVDGEAIEVVDTREILPHMPAPRGINHIALLNGRGEVVRAIHYADERPLRCAGDRLLLWSSIDLYDGSGLGNVLIFSEGGRVARAVEVPITTLPEGLLAPGL